jgi:hypothetical protein
VIGRRCVVVTRKRDSCGPASIRRHTVRASVHAQPFPIENIRQLLDGETRFSEVEIAQESVVFGNVARLTSVYEFTWQSPQETRRGRGVNFFTLVGESGEWRVMSIVWDNERPGLSLPPEVYAPRAAS